MVVCVKVLVQAVLGWSWYSSWWWQAQLQYLERDCERCQHQAAVGGAEAPEQHSHQQYSLYSYTCYNYNYTSNYSYSMILMQDRVLGETVSSYSDELQKLEKLQ